VAEQQSDVSDVAVQLARRSFAHDVAAQIENIGINDEQRMIILLDMARCFEDHALALKIWELLRDEFGDSINMSAG